MASKEKLIAAKELLEMGLLDQTEYDSIAEQVRASTKKDPVPKGTSSENPTNPQPDKVFSHQDLKQGSVLSGYTILEKRGSHSMGTSYQVQATADSNAKGERFLLKLLHPQLSSRIFRTNFKKEAKRAIQYRHPNIMSIYEVVEERGNLGIVVEDVAGHPFSVWMKQKSPSFTIKMRILRILGSALDALHQNGLVHKDLKPENIVFRPDGKICILNIGMSSDFLKMNTERADYFKSPEQLESQKSIPQTDQYALAMLAYQMFSATYPWKEGTSPVSIATLKMSGSLIHLSDRIDMFPHLSAVVMKALSHSPKDRFRNCIQFVIALMQAQKKDALTKAKNKQEEHLPIPSTVEPVKAPIQMKAQEKPASPTSKPAKNAVSYPHSKAQPDSPFSQKEIPKKEVEERKESTEIKNVSHPLNDNLPHHLPNMPMGKQNPFSGTESIRTSEKESDRSLSVNTTTSDKTSLGKKNAELISDSVPSDSILEPPKKEKEKSDIFDEPPPSPPVVEAPKPTEIAKLKWIFAQLGLQSLVEEMDERDEMKIFYVQVIGVGNVGKSSLINTLAGKEIAPINFLPLTWKIDLYVRSKEQEYAILTYVDGTEQQLSLSDARDLCAQEEQKGKSARRSGNVYTSPLVKVVWFVDAPLLPIGVALVDTPGFAQEGRAETQKKKSSMGISLQTREKSTEFLHMADVVLWVLRADKIQSTLNKNMYQELCSLKRKAILCLNYWDKISSKNRPEARKLCHSYFRNVIDTIWVSVLKGNHPEYQTYRSSIQASFQSITAQRDHLKQLSERQNNAEQSYKASLIARTFTQSLAVGLENYFQLVDTLHETSHSFTKSLHKSIQQEVKKAHSKALSNLRGAIAKLELEYNSAETVFKNDILKKGALEKPIQNAIHRKLFDFTESIALLGSHVEFPKYTKISLDGRSHQEVFALGDFRISVKNIDVKTSAWSDAVGGDNDFFASIGRLLFGQNHDIERRFNNGVTKWKDALEKECRRKVKSKIKNLKNTFKNRLTKKFKKVYQLTIDQALVEVLKLDYFDQVLSPVALQESRVFFQKIKSLKTHDRRKSIDAARTELAFELAFFQQRFIPQLPTQVVDIDSERLQKIQHEHDFSWNTQNIDTKLLQKIKAYLFDSPLMEVWREFMEKHSQMFLPLPESYTKRWVMTDKLQFREEYFSDNIFALIKQHEKRFETLSYRHREVLTLYKSRPTLPKLSTLSAELRDAKSQLATAKSARDFISAVLLMSLLGGFGSCVAICNGELGAIVMFGIAGFAFIFASASIESSKTAVIEKENILASAESQLSTFYRYEKHRKKINVHEEMLGTIIAEYLQTFQRDDVHKQHMLVSLLTKMIKRQ